MKLEEITRKDNANYYFRVTCLHKRKPEVTHSENHWLKKRDSVGL